MFKREPDNVKSGGPPFLVNRAYRSAFVHYIHFLEMPNKLACLVYRRYILIAVSCYNQSFTSNRNAVQGIVYEIMINFSLYSLFSTLLVCKYIIAQW